MGSLLDGISREVTWLHLHFRKAAEEWPGLGWEVDSRVRIEARKSVKWEEIIQMTDKAQIKELAVGKKRFWT